MRRCPILLSTAVLILLAARADAADRLQPLRLVTVPTAGTLPAKALSVETYLFDDGGMMVRASAGVFNLMTVGMSYSGSGVAGSEDAAWQPHAGFNFRVRIVEESMRSPAVAVGYDSQGDGPYVREAGRFRVKSRGAYLAVSRNYRLFGDLGFHGGVGYTPEEGVSDRDPTFWAGLDKSLGPFLDAVAEFDAATNDDTSGAFDGRDGYLNAALIWRAGSAFELEFTMKNLLRSPILDPGGAIRTDPRFSREFRFAWSRRF